MALDYLPWVWVPERSMSEKLEWLTNIIESYDGSEQRIRLRNAPIQSYDVSVSVYRRESAAAMNMAISGWQGELWGWPLWPEMNILSSALPAGSSVIPFSTVCAEYNSGDDFILWQSDSIYEVFTTGTVAEDGIILADAAVTALDHPAGTYVMPIRTAMMGSQVGRKDNRGILEQLSLTMKCTAPALLTGAASDIQYLSADVMTDNFLLTSQTMERTIDRAMLGFDPGLGNWTQEAQTAYPVVVTQHYWRTRTSSEAWTLRLWLHRREGRLNPVWIPSRRDDLILADIVSASNPVISIKDINYRVLGIDQPTSQHVAIFACDGTFVCRKILSAVAGTTGKESLTLDSAIGFTDVARISFLNLHRMVSDRVEFAWESLGVAEVRASMVGVAQ